MVAAISATPARVNSQCTATLDASPAMQARVEQESRDGDPQRDIDQRLLNELARLNSASGVNAKLKFSPGAGACVNLERAVIYLGLDLVKRLQEKLSTNERVKGDTMLRNFAEAPYAAARFALAHEYAHLLQHNGTTGSERAVRSAGATREKGKLAAANREPAAAPEPLAIGELQADCIAGHLLGHDLARLDVDIRPLLAAIETAMVLGDEAWNDPAHHGAALSRRSCAGAGVRSGQGQQFGPLNAALGDRAQRLLDWSLAEARTTFKRDRNQRVF